MHRWVNSNQAAHWDRRRTYRHPQDPAARAFAEPKIDWFCRQLGIGPSTKLLDVGAGNGMFTWWWSQCVDQVVGVELSENMLERSPCRDLLRPGDAYELPFEDNSFDVVFAGNLLHHLDRPGDALLEMSRVSRRGIAVCEPNRNHLPMAAFGAASTVCRGLLHYSRQSLRSLASGARLEVRTVTVHGYVYENRSPNFSLPLARRLEQVMPGGAYILLAATTPDSEPSEAVPASERSTLIREAERCERAR